MYYVVGLVNKFKKMDEFGSYITCKYAWDSPVTGKPHASVWKF
jgi:hypothetical protein